MAQAHDQVRRHYDAEADPSPLVTKVIQVLETLGEAPCSATQLEGLDQFHVRGLEATGELVSLVGLRPQMRILDAGSGLGGPSRFLASLCGCRVTGVDLTPSYVDVAKILADWTSLNDRVDYEVGDLLALRFDDQTFDLVWTQHVVMNIADRDRLYPELRRVLKPGGQLAFYDVIAADGHPDLVFPVPWAESADASTLLTEAETRTALQAAGFHVALWKDVTAEALAWFAEPRPPTSPGLSLATVMGSRFSVMGANLGRNLNEGRARLVMGVAQAVQA